jgi:heme-degrading monooxygenase HmoA
MSKTIDPNGRTAIAPDSLAGQPVTLINKFVVAPGRDDVFVEAWTEASMYFRAQPGYLSLRLHRAASPDAEYRYVNVARWKTLGEFRAAHSTEEFRRVVGQDKWKEFPSTPVLYEVIASDDAESSQPANA